MSMTPYYADEQVTLRDKDGCTWRPHPTVAGEWQILVVETQAWSDADLFPDDGPFIAECGLAGCRVCPVNCTYDELPEAVQILAHSQRAQAAGKGHIDGDGRCDDPDYQNGIGKESHGRA